MSHLVVRSKPRPGFYGSANGLCRDPESGHLIREVSEVAYPVKATAAYIHTSYRKHVEYQSGNYEGDMTLPDRMACAQQLRVAFASASWEQRSAQGDVYCGSYYSGPYSSSWYHWASADVQATVWALPTISDSHPYIKEVAFTVSNVVAPSGSGSPRVACCFSTTKTSGLPTSYADLEALPSVLVSAGKCRIDLRTLGLRVSDFVYCTLFAYIDDFQPASTNNGYNRYDESTVYVETWMNSTPALVVTCGI